MGGEESKPVRYTLVPPVLQRKRPRRFVEAHEQDFEDAGREVRRLLHDLYTVDSTVSAEIFASPQENLDCYAEIHQPHQAIGGNTIEGSLLLTGRAAPFTVESMLFSKNGGGTSIILGHTSRDDNTASFVGLEHMVNSPAGLGGYGGGAGTRLKAGVFHRYRQLSCGATITSPLDLTLNAASLRGGFSELRHHVNGNVWALLKHDAIALGTACQLVDGQPDELSGVICYRNQWARPDEPCTELTLRTTQKLRDAQATPSFHGSYYQRMVTRRNVKNPLEEPGVHFITNYVDMGVEATISATGTRMAVGAAWQINKNAMLKGKIGNSAFSLTFVAKSWWDPSATVALTVSNPFAGATRVGLAFSLENWGNVGYQKAKETYRRYVPVMVEEVSDQTESDDMDSYLKRRRMPSN